MDIKKLGQQGYDTYLGILDTQKTIGIYDMGGHEAAELAKAQLLYGRTPEEMIQLYDSVFAAANRGTKSLPSKVDVAKIATGLAKILSEAETVQDYMK